MRFLIHLLQVKSFDSGLFGPLSTYFGTVETSGLVNPFNPALMSITRSNHNVNCIPSNVKALALVGYITNNATKGDCSQYQRVMGAAFVQKSSGGKSSRYYKPWGTITCRKFGSQTQSESLQPVGLRQRNQWSIQQKRRLASRRVPTRPSKRKQQGHGRKIQPTP